MSKTRKFPRWSETECDECGIPFQVTRTEAKTFTGKIMCSDCGSYWHGYNDAKKNYTTYIENRIKELKPYIDSTEITDGIYDELLDMLKQIN